MPHIRVIEDKDCDLCATDAGVAGSTPASGTQTLR